MRFKYTDYHVHTKWSHDIAKNGPSFENYAVIAEKNQINICFLDHYELYYIEHDKTYPFFEGKINKYLEEVDQIKETFDFVLSGLEVDYYKEYENKLKEFMDQYENQFDFIAGTVHETDLGLPFTTREKLVKLLQKKDLKAIVDNFFDLTEDLIKSKIFKNICHLDTIFRYINKRDLKPSQDIDISDERILNLGRLCINNDIKIEYNLSGIKYPIGRPFPSKSIITQLIKEGAEIFIGSDSHNLNYFRTIIPMVKEEYNNLNIRD